MKKYLFLALLPFLSLALQAGVVKGRVTSQGRPVAGVKVSDGRQIVLTDARGRYRLQSDKADSVVFITTPSGYTASMIDGIRPGFWQLLTKPSCRTEVHDFTLVPQNQDKYSVIFITDCHLAADPSRNDLARFKTDVLPAICREAEEASAKGAVISVNLGDFAHDRYWYDFGLNESAAERFIADAGYPVPLYSVSGNHDNDAAIAGLGERTDFVSAWNYRHTWGPGCYSVEIGGDHWIFMDSVEYLNDGEPDARHRNINGRRNYNCRFLEKDLEWLRADVALIPKGARVFFCCHVPVFNDYSNSEVMMPGQAELLDEIFRDFPKVYLFAGHTHKHLNTSTRGMGRFEQFIFSATSGNMWKHPDGYAAIGSDACDQAFNVLDCSSPDPKPRNVPVSGSGDMMRVYDLNSVGDFYRNDPGCNIMHRLYPKRSWYADQAFRNMIYVNCWAYGPGVSVEMFEGGEALEVRRSELDDPLYVVTYVTPQLTESSKASKGEAKDRKNPHAFTAVARTATLPVTVKVTGPDGTVLCEKTIERPFLFNHIISL